MRDLPILKNPGANRGEAAPGGKSPHQPRPASDWSNFGDNYPTARSLTSENLEIGDAQRRLTGDKDLSIWDAGV